MTPRFPPGGTLLGVLSGHQCARWRELLQMRPWPERPGDASRGVIASGTMPYRLGRKTWTIAVEVGPYGPGEIGVWFGQKPLRNPFSLSKRSKP